VNNKIAVADLERLRARPSADLEIDLSQAGDPVLLEIRSQVGQIVGVLVAGALSQVPRTMRWASRSRVCSISACVRYANGWPAPVGRTAVSTAMAPLYTCHRGRY
jgi:hypothetical protein